MLIPNYFTKGFLVLEWSMVQVVIGNNSICVQFVLPSATHVNILYSLKHIYCIPQNDCKLRKFGLSPKLV